MTLGKLWVTLDRLWANLERDIIKTAARRFLPSSLPLNSSVALIKSIFSVGLSIAINIYKIGCTLLWAWVLFCILTTLHKLYRRRPYRVECTGSLSTSEVKQHRARSVLGWGTAWEDLRVLSAFSIWSCKFLYMHVYVCHRSGVCR